MQKLRICIAEDSKVVRAAIQSLLTNSGYFELVGAAQDGREALDICKDSKPQVVLLDVSMPGMDGIEAARQITAICPDSVVIMLSSQDDMDVIREALKAGARDFIRKPVHGPELIQKILSIYAREGSRRSGTADTGRRKIITLTSPKTGVGTTTIAINTAVCMVKKFRKRVLAIDLDFNYADTSHCLGRKTQPSIGELLGQTDPQRLENIRKYIIETASGVHLLPGPASPMPQISRESAVETIIRAVEPDFDFVFVDLVPSPTDLWVRCLESSDQVLLVLSSDVPAIRSAKLCLETLKRTKLGSRRIKVVYNHLSMEGVSSKDVQDFINCPVYAEICCDREAVTSAYLSRTPFLLGEMNQISKDVETLTEKIFSGREAL